MVSESLPEVEPDRFLAIARIARSRGRRGEVVADILTDFPARFEDLRQAFLEQPGQSPKALDVEHAWFHKGRVVLKFSGIDSIESASRLRGLHVLILRDQRTQLPPHHYYFWELQGCRVIVERQGERYEVGMVTYVEPTGGVDLLHVARGGHRGEVLIPLAQAICKQIDTPGKTIVIDPLEDLLDLN